MLHILQNGPQWTEHSGKVSWGARYQRSPFLAFSLCHILHPPSPCLTPFIGLRLILVALPKRELTAESLVSPTFNPLLHLPAPALLPAHLYPLGVFFSPGLLPCFFSCWSLRWPLFLGPVFTIFLKLLTFSSLIKGQVLPVQAVELGASSWHSVQCWGLRGRLEIRLWSERFRIGTPWEDLQYRWLWKGMSGFEPGDFRETHK